MSHTTQPRGSTFPDPRRPPRQRIQLSAPHSRPTPARAVRMPAALPSLARWTALCAAAEAVGMTAAAGAAKLSQALVGEPQGGREVALVLAIVVAGGLVEGGALGLAQASGLRGLLPARSRRAWLAVTVVVAGLGWAGASLPGTLAGDDSGASPAWLLVVAGALALGAVMGAVLGTAQAPVLRGRVAHPWRWVGASTASWPLAMAAIFFGATAPSPDWPAGAVVLLGTVTGAVAGALLGLVSGWFLPSLTGRAPHHRLVATLLGTPLSRLLGRSLMLLQVTGATSGRVIELPVSFAEDRDGFIVVPGRPETKRWWRNLRAEAPVRMLVDGRWRDGEAVVVTPRGSAYVAARTAYVRRWPQAKLPADQPLVRIWPRV